MNIVFKTKLSQKKKKKKSLFQDSHVYWKSRFAERRRGKDLLFLVHFPNGSKNWSWANPKPGSRAFIKASNAGTEGQTFGISSESEKQIFYLPLHSPHGSNEQVRFSNIELHSGFQYECVTMCWDGSWLSQCKGQREQGFGACVETQDNISVPFSWFWQNPWDLSSVSRALWDPCGPIEKGKRLMVNLVFPSPSSSSGNLGTFQ